VIESFHGVPPVCIQLSVFRLNRYSVVGIIMGGTVTTGLALSTRTATSLVAPFKKNKDVLREAVCSTTTTL
jgi:hypothetical protein